MTRSSRVLLTSLLAFVLITGSLAAAEHRNVVLFVVDDQGFQAGCYGNKVFRTPAIDSLAANGTRFTRGHCTTASCSACRSVFRGSRARPLSTLGDPVRTMPRTRASPAMISPCLSVML